MFNCRPIFFLCLSSCCFFLLNAQNTPLSETFDFKDGVYLSFEEFKGNIPTYTGSEVELFYVDSNDYHLEHISKIKVNGKKIASRKIWGICYKGKPYINYRGGIFEAGANKDLLKNQILFSRIDIIGALCVFNIDIGNKNRNTNPFINYPMPGESKFNLNKLLDINTGEVYPLEYPYVEHFIKNDKELYNDIMKHKIDINLFDFIIAYNRRNPVYPSPVSLSYPKKSGSSQ